MDERGEWVVQDAEMGVRQVVLTNIRREHQGQDNATSSALPWQAWLNLASPLGHHWGTTGAQLETLTKAVPLGANMGVWLVGLALVLADPGLPLGCRWPGAVRVRSRLAASG